MPARVYRTVAESEASRAVDAGEYVSRLRRSLRWMTGLVLALAAIIAALMVFLVRVHSS